MKETVVTALISVVVATSSLLAQTQTLSITGINVWSQGQTGMTLSVTAHLLRLRFRFVGSR